MRRINGIGQNGKTKKKPSRCFFYKLLLPVLFILSGTLYSYAQKSDIWTFYKDYNGMKVYTQTDEFHDYSNGLHYEYVILKFQNTTDKDKKVEISEVLFYDGKKNNQDNAEINTLYISSGETIMGNFSDKSPECLKIFSRFLNYTDKPVLSGFEIIINQEDI